MSLVSVCIPAFNPLYYEVALKSALNQTYRNIEILIGDDCPSPAIELMTKKYTDKRIQYIRNDPPRKEHGNLDYLMRIAKGKYIKPLNDDDVLMPKCIEMLVDAIEKNTGCTLSTSKRDIIDSSGLPQEDMAPTSLISIIPCQINGDIAITYSLTRILNMIGEPSTALFRKEDIYYEDVPAYYFAGRDYSFAFYDMVMWSKLLSRGSLSYIPETLSFLRVHPQQTTNNPDKAYKLAQTWYYLLTDTWNKGMWRNKDDYLAAIGNQTKYYSWARGNLCMNKEQEDSIQEIIDKLLEEYEFQSMKVAI